MKDGFRGGLQTTEKAKVEQEKRKIVNSDERDSRKTKHLPPGYFKAF